MVLWKGDSTWVGSQKHRNGIYLKTGASHKLVIWSQITISDLFKQRKVGSPPIVDIFLFRHGAEWRSRKDTCGLKRCSLGALTNCTAIWGIYSYYTIRGRCAAVIYQIVLSSHLHIDALGADRIHKFIFRRANFSRLAVAPHITEKTVKYCNVYKDAVRSVF